MVAAAWHKRYAQGVANFTSRPIFTRGACEPSGACKLGVGSNSARLTSEGRLSPSQLRNYLGTLVFFDDKVNL